MTDRIQASAWNVDFAVPPEGRFKYARNMSASVLAATALRAGAVVEVEFPGAVIHNISRATRGDRHVLIDQELPDNNSYSDSESK